MKTRYFLLMAAATLGLSSCQKDFDPASYAPPLNIGGYTSAKQIAPSNLVAYWAFDGSLIDSVSNIGGVNTGTSFTVGVKKQSLQGALDSYVISNTPPAVQNLKSFTLTCWEKMPLNDKGMVGLIDVANSAKDWGNLLLFFENGGASDKGVLKFHVNNNGADNWGDNTTVTNPWGQWNQIALSYDEVTSTYTLYFNGSKIGSKVIAGNGPLMFQNAQKMVFGAAQFQTTPSLSNTMGKQSWASYLVGQLDEVRIYNKALSIAEISSLAKLEGRGK
ncbi:LamG domain-containing protein [Pedobacter sp. KR3-3]|uniref:LamG domain-containing protein n=1 Tax=Pedobacter albus TaxID=3113905 RepID=A0ABU7ICI4_9SPHI|nr:LamG domain-containing protein [Pedobacter sp. KR3-3]MEE1947195.1 LamG domain-containing protein [Pedobacter sp. KR3-3]